MIDFKNKVVTADEAVTKAIKEGDTVVVGHAAGVPRLCLEACSRNMKSFRDVKVFHKLVLGDLPHTAPEAVGHMRLVTSFAGPNSRQALEENRADFVPLFFYQLPRYFHEGFIGCDVAMIQVSEPNEEGYCSYGISCDYTKPAAEKARVVIAEMNKQTPFICGDNLIHVSEIDYIVEADYALPELGKPTIGEVEKGIGRNIASLVQDGDTLQLGIGAIPDAVLLFLGDKKDLGIHTEMFSDGAMELVKQGVITGKKKELEPEKLTATFLMGSKELYEWADHNESIYMAPVDYVNDPVTIMKLDNMVSINSCIEVDLMGQVASETMGLRQFSGTGGQVDYVRGAAMAKNGRSIMAMPSTARKGTISRIVANLTPGSAVTTLRTDVDYVVTEHGIAHLKGKTLRERAEALIAIAHPDFRSELQKAYDERFPKYVQ